jgi:hypothetical protein
MNELKCPIRSLRVCKMVCKDWTKIITSPEFVQEHHKATSPAVFIYDDSDVLGNNCCYLLESLSDTHDAGGS